ncbi:FAD-dependent oxidoreductase [Nocardioides marmoriginsengisoli]|uniref:FAD-dependent oxidoreductase n=1 Tax=Nocardioides marmoriginsengisoli TaxID=661483 RepID=A0A3N0CK36_9ACTN|nr:FAD-dependent oxidoreductase [Nocardioides marmoriginsengisoli]
MIVGASASGLAVAETLRREGFAGRLTLVGDEVHPPYDRPPLSKQLLSGEWDKERVALRRSADLEALSADFVLGAAAAGLDAEAGEVFLSDGQRLGYERLVIATGVRPRRLPGQPALVGIHTMRTLEDSLTLSHRLKSCRKLVVVGGGFLGAEIAAVARGLGSAVTLVEPAPAPLAPALGERVGESIADLHRERGVDVRTGVAVREFVANGSHVTGVVLSDGTELPADDVVVAVGSDPNVEWLATSGLHIDNGLVCDEYMEVAENVYASGDVARAYNPLFGEHIRVEHRTHAAEQGMAVARRIMREAAADPFCPVPYFWSDQYDLKIQAYGNLRGHDEVAVVDGQFEGHRFLALYRRGDRVTGVLAMGLPPKVVHGQRKLIAERTEWSSALENVPSPVVVAQ